jgi:hypothetical protein
MSYTKQTAWEFACGWYTEQSVRIGLTHSPKPARDVDSEFVKWLTEQMRLAMAKGIDIGRRWDEENGA